MEPAVAAPVTGNRAAQVTVHSALPCQSVSLGPARFDFTGAINNVVIRGRIDDPPSGGGGLPGTVRVLATTSAPASKPGAGAIVAS